MHRFVAAALLLTASAWAHDPKLHKGPVTTGVVAAVSAESFDLKTKTATVKVTFTDKTKFEHGNATVDKSHVKKGESVSVIGTKLPTGELVAKEVLLGVGDSHPA
ncbi:MAG TPA: DUF5666 domain-containing protein, partial [Rariglobus sp.]